MARAGRLLERRFPTATAASSPKLLWKCFAALPMQSCLLVNLTNILFASFVWSLYILETSRPLPRPATASRWPPTCSQMKDDTPETPLPTSMVALPGATHPSFGKFPAAAVRQLASSEPTGSRRRRHTPPAHNAIPANPTTPPRYTPSLRPLQPHDRATARRAIHSPYPHRTSERLLNRRNRPSQN